MPTRSYYDHDGVRVEVDLSRIVHESVCDFCGQVIAPEDVQRGMVRVDMAFTSSREYAFITHKEHALQAAGEVLAIAIAGGRG